MTGHPTSYAALLTGPGTAAIAVVRLVGPRIGAFAAAHLSRPPKPGRCVHCNLADGTRIIDDPVVVLSDDQATLDINLHGGAWVVRACLDLCQRAGFEIITADERVMDALPPIDRDMQLDIPKARTLEGLRMLLDQPRRWAAFEWNRENIRGVIDNATLWWMLHPPRLAIVGIPNAGKSTLANQLFGQERSITADVPGTTRDYVGDFATIDGLPVMLLDTPGQRTSIDPIETAAIELSQAQIQSANLVLLIIDPTQPAAPQRALADRYPQALVVVNKADRAPNDLPAHHVRTTATTGEGVDALRRQILERLGIRPATTSPLYWTANQLALLNEAMTSEQKLEDLLQHARGSRVSR